MKTIIAGGRDFTNYEFAREKLLEYEITEIISGGARGADQIGEQFAREQNKPLKVFPADWNKYGKSAGYRRNEQMAEYGEQLIAFWDGKSKGTKHMIDLAVKNKLKVKVIMYE